MLALRTSLQELQDWVRDALDRQWAAMEKEVGRVAGPDVALEGRLTGMQQVQELQAGLLVEVGDKVLALRAETRAMVDAATADVLATARRLAGDRDRDRLAGAAAATTTLAFPFSPPSRTEDTFALEAMQAGLEVAKQALAGLRRDTDRTAAGLEEVRRLAEGGAERGGEAEHAAGRAAARAEAAEVQATKAADLARERCLRAEHLEDLVKAEQAQRRQQARDLERCAAALAELGPRVESLEGNTRTALANSDMAVTRLSSAFGECEAGLSATTATLEALARRIGRLEAAADRGPSALEVAGRLDGLARDVATALRRAETAEAAATRAELGGGARGRLELADWSAAVERLDRAALSAMAADRRLTAVTDQCAADLANVTERLLTAERTVAARATELQRCETDLRAELHGVAAAAERERTSAAKRVADVERATLDHQAQAALTLARLEEQARGVATRLAVVERGVRLGGSDAPAGAFDALERRLGAFESRYAAELQALQRSALTPEAVAAQVRALVADGAVADLARDTAALGTAVRAAERSAGRLGDEVEALARRHGHTDSRLTRLEDRVEAMATAAATADAPRRDALAGLLDLPLAAVRSQVEGLERAMAARVETLQREVAALTSAVQHETQPQLAQFQEQVGLLHVQAATTQARVTELLEEMNLIRGGTPIAELRERVMAAERVLRRLEGATNLQSRLTREDVLQLLEAGTQDAVEREWGRRAAGLATLGQRLAAAERDVAALAEAQLGIASVIAHVSAVRPIPTSPVPPSVTAPIPSPNSGTSPAEVAAIIPQHANTHPAAPASAAQRLEFAAALDSGPAPSVRPAAPPVAGVDDGRTSGATAAAPLQVAPGWLDPASIDASGMAHDQLRRASAQTLGVPAQPSPPLSMPPSDPSAAVASPAAAPANPPAPPTLAGDPAPAPAAPAAPDAANSLARRMSPGDQQHFSVASNLDPPPSPHAMSAEADRPAAAHPSPASSAITAAPAAPAEDRRLSSASRQGSVGRASEAKTPQPVEPPEAPPRGPAGQYAVQTAVGRRALHLLRDDSDGSSSGGETSLVPADEAARVKAEEEEEEDDDDDEFDVLPADPQSSVLQTPSPTAATVPGLAERSDDAVTAQAAADLALGPPAPPPSGLPAQPEGSDSEFDSDAPPPAVPSRGRPVGGRAAPQAPQFADSFSDSAPEDAPTPEDLPIVPSVALRHSPSIESSGDDNPASENLLSEGCYPSQHVPVMAPQTSGSTTVTSGPPSGAVAGSGTGTGTSAQRGAAGAALGDRSFGSGDEDSDSLALPGQGEASPSAGSEDGGEGPDAMAHSSLPDPPAMVDTARDSASPAPEPEASPPPTATPARTLPGRPSQPTGRARQLALLSSLGRDPFDSDSAEEGVATPQPPVPPGGALDVGDETVLSPTLFRRPSPSDTPVRSPDTPSDSSTCKPAGAARGRESSAEDSDAGAPPPTTYPAPRRQSGGSHQDSSSSKPTDPVPVLPPGLQESKVAEDMSAAPPPAPAVRRPKGLALLAALDRHSSSDSDAAALADADGAGAAVAQSSDDEFDSFGAAIAAGPQPSKRPHGDTATVQPQPQQQPPAPGHAAEEGMRAAVGRGSFSGESGEASVASAADDLPARTPPRSSDGSDKSDEAPGSGVLGDSDDGSLMLPDDDRDEADHDVAHRPADPPDSDAELAVSAAPPPAPAVRRPKGLALLAALDRHSSADSDAAALADGAGAAVAQSSDDEFDSFGAAVAAGPQPSKRPHGDPATGQSQPPQQPPAPGAPAGHAAQEGTRAAVGRGSFSGESGEASVALAATDDLPARSPPRGSDGSDKSDDAPGSGLLGDSDLMLPDDDRDEADHDVAHRPADPPDSDAELAVDDSASDKQPGPSAAGGLGDEGDSGDDAFGQPPGSESPGHPPPSPAPAAPPAAGRSSRIAALAAAGDDSFSDNSDGGAGVPRNAAPAAPPPPPPPLSDDDNAASDTAPPKPRAAGTPTPGSERSSGDGSEALAAPLPDPPKSKPAPGRAALRRLNSDASFSSGSLSGGGGGGAAGGSEASAAAPAQRSGGPADGGTGTGTGSGFSDNGSGFDDDDGSLALSGLSEGPHQAAAPAKPPAKPFTLSSDDDVPLPPVRPSLPAAPPPKPPARHGSSSSGSSAGKGPPAAAAATSSSRAAQPKPKPKPRRALAALDDTDSSGSEVLPPHPRPPRASSRASSRSSEGSGVGALPGFDSPAVPGLGAGRGRGRPQWKA